MTPYSSTAIGLAGIAKKICPVVALVPALLLGACTEAPAMDTGDSRRVEAATERMKAEQARIDGVEATRRARRAAAYKHELALSEIQRGIRRPDEPAR